MDATAIFDLALPFAIAGFATVWTFWGLEWWLKRASKDTAAEPGSRAGS